MTDYERVRTDQGAIALPGFSIIHISGEDTIEWLQGQVTNDVRPLSKGDSVSACFCNPTGQIMSVVDIHPDPRRSGFLIVCPRETKAAILDRIEQMVIMEDVEANDLPDLHLTTVQGPNAQPKGDLYFSNDRTGSGGYDIWSNEPFVGTSISVEAFEVLRIESGNPAFGVDINAKTLPPELGPAFESKHVSYVKGCYVGQEILMRIHSRGHTNKTWVGLVSDSPLEAGDQIDGGGTITSAALSPETGQIAAATLKNDLADEGQIVRIQTERGDVTAEVKTMPLFRRL